MGSRMHFRCISAGFNCSTVDTHRNSKTQTPLLRLVVDLLYNKPYNKSTTKSSSPQNAPSNAIILLLIIIIWSWYTGPQPAQAPPRCTKCNSPSINGHCVTFTVLLYNGPLLRGFKGCLWRHNSTQLNWTQLNSTDPVEQRTAKSVVFLFMTSRPTNWVNCCSRCERVDNSTSSWV